MKKKILLSFAILLSCSVSFLSAKSQSGILSSALSGLRISSGYTNAFSLYNMDTYSKIAPGAFLGYEYTLLPDLSRGLDAGFYGKTSYQYFVPYNLQLNRLESFTFSGGLFFQFNLKNDISIVVSTGAGFMIDIIDFTSAEGKQINDVYYDFALEGDFYIRKKIDGNKNCLLLMGPGCHFSFYNEKTKNYCSLGPGFSLCIDFKPAGHK